MSGCYFENWKHTVVLDGAEGVTAQGCCYTCYPGEPPVRFYGGAETRNNTFQGFVTADGSDSHVSNWTMGKVGVGSSTPVQQLHSRTPGANGLQYGLEIQNPDGTDTGGTATGVLFSTETPHSYGKGAIVYERKSSFARGAFHFLQNKVPDVFNPTLADAVMSVTNDGNVGIGTTGPSEKLEIAGKTKIASGPAAPLNLPILTSDPASPSNGDLWIYTRGGVYYLKLRTPGGTKTLGRG